MNWFQDAWTVASHVITIVNFIFILFVLFFERKEPGRRLGWLLALIFVPVLGMVFYLLFSGHFFARNRRMQESRTKILESITPWLNEQRRYIKENAKYLQNNELSRFLRLVDMNIIYGKSLMTLTETLKIYTWGKDMFKDMIDDLENAKEHIHMEYFIFRNDAIGKQVLEILCRKARSGVEVKLMYDDLGSFFVPINFFKPLKDAGGEVNAFFPVRFVLPVSINFRNHRKITVIDGRIGYMGGINVGDEYLNQKRSGRQVLWRDTHVRMTGSSVLELQTAFLTDWYSIAYKIKRKTNVDEIVKKYFPLEDFYNYNKVISETSMPSIIKNNNEQKLIPSQIVISGPDEINNAEIRDAMIRMIMSAHQSIYIQTPYFTPDEPFNNALRIAVVSGIDVRIMVPGCWDKFYVKAAAYPYIRSLLELGAKFYSYPGFIHAKTIVVDGKILTLGSTNIDNRSFKLHFEVNTFFYDKKTACQYKRIFLKDQKISTQLTSEWFNSHCILIRAWWGFWNLFSPLM